MLNILVTAVGSELAFAVMKAVKLFNTPYRLFGTDTHRNVVGKYWCENFYQVPPAKDELGYIEALEKIIKAKKITVLVPTADMEILTLSKYKEEFKKSFGCHILVNENGEIIRFTDKWLSYLWFVEHGIPSPRSFLVEDEEGSMQALSGLNYPMILKPRTGGGSRSVFKVQSPEDVVKYRVIVPRPVLQEYLSPDDEEYTAGTYKTKDGEVYSIVLKRTLKFGMTNTAEVVKNKDLANFAKSVILKTNLKGSSNIQFRVTAHGPKVLEINPRFSGTTSIRAHFGFNDVLMSVNEAVFNTEISEPRIKQGFVLRFMEEQYHFS